MLAVSALLLVVIIAGIATSGGGSEDAETKTQDAKDADEMRKGFHCLSPWDGNHDGLEALVRHQLNDPGSMETLETRITPVDNFGDHFIITEFTAKNAFGGVVRHVADGIVDNETCEATLSAIN